MSLRISKPKDAIAGSLFVAIGAAAWLGSRGLQVGTATHMGPGYFPQCLGILLVVLGAVSVLRAFGPPMSEPGMPRALTPLLLILLGVTGFYLLIDRAGLVAAIFVLVAFACAPQLRRRPLEVLAIFVMLAGFSVAVFINGFGMPFRAF
jgi:putative tricarboxylic transport membrane protein